MFTNVVTWSKRCKLKLGITNGNFAVSDTYRHQEKFDVVTKLTLLREKETCKARYTRARVVDTIVLQNISIVKGAGCGTLNEIRYE